MKAGNIKIMPSKMRFLLVASTLVAIATPLLAQQGFSEGFTFLKGVRERDGDAVQALVSRPNNAVINAREADTGEGALHILVRGRDLNWLSFLLSRGARPDLQSRDGTSPLMLAAQIGWVEGAEQLLARRANVNLANARGETALIFAVQRRDLPMVRLLRSQGADVNLTDSVAGYSALDYARQDRRAAAILRALE